MFLRYYKLVLYPQLIFLVKVWHLVIEFLPGCYEAPPDFSPLTARAGMKKSRPGIVPEFRKTTTQLPPQTSSPYSFDSMNRPNTTRDGRSEGVGQGRIGRVLYKLIKKQRNYFNSKAHLLFGKSLTRRRNWLPKRHPMMTAGTQTIRID